MFTLATDYAQWAGWVAATIAFGVGTFLIGFDIGRKRHHGEAIRRGFAKFNEINGRREWRAIPLDPEEAARMGLAWNGNKDEYAPK